MNEVNATVITKDKALKASQKLVEARSALQNIDAQIATEIATIEASHDKARKRYEGQLDEAQAIIAAYSEANREDLCPDGKKSFKLGAVTVSWRLNPAKLVPKEGLKIKDVIAKFVGRKYAQYVVMSQTSKLDTKKVLADALDGPLKNKLATLGLEIKQEEKFDIK